MADRPDERDSLASRRSFLRGSALAAVAVGLAASFPWEALAAQDAHAPQAGADKDDKDDKGKKDEKPQETPHGDEHDGKDQNDKDTNDSGQTKTDPTLVTRHDANGGEYRICPECGSNMYRQNQTWTCENCGYTYVE